MKTESIKFGFCQRFTNTQVLATDICFIPLYSIRGWYTAVTANITTGWGTVCDSSALLEPKQCLDLGTAWEMEDFLGIHDRKKVDHKFSLTLKYMICDGPSDAVQRFWNSL